MDRRKKILFTIPALLGGGAERVIINMINQIDIKYFKIFLLVLNKKGCLHSSITNEITTIDLNISRTRYALLGIIKTINKANPDIVFSTTHRMNIFILFASFFTKNKIKYFVREPNMPSLLIHNGQLNKIKLIIIKFLYQFAYRIIAQTDEMKYDIIQTYGLTDRKIITIYNPIDYDFINKSIKNSKDPFDHNYINIVSSGRIIDQKAYDILIKAFKIVFNKNPNFRLYILGEDVVGLKQDLLQLVEKLELTSSIFFEGFIKNPYPYYKYSDLFVLSSRWEGLPNVVIENLYLKKPIVTTDCIKYLSSLIINGKNGFVLPVDNYNLLAEKILDYNNLEPNNTYIPTNVNDIFNQHI